MPLHTSSLVGRFSWARLTVKTRGCAAFPPSIFFFSPCGKKEKKVWKGATKSQFRHKAAPMTQAASRTAASTSTLDLRRTEGGWGATRRLRPCSKSSTQHTKDAVRNTNAQRNTDAPLYEKKPFVPLGGIDLSVSKPSRGAQTPLPPHHLDQKKLNHQKFRQTSRPSFPSIRPLLDRMRRRRGRKESGKGRNRRGRKDWETGQEEDVCDTTACASLRGARAPLPSRSGRAAQLSIKPREPSFLSLDKR